MYLNSKGANLPVPTFVADAAAAGGEEAAAAEEEAGAVAEAEAGTDPADATE
jgi:cytochrome c